MGAGHVLGKCRVAAAVGRADMTGDALPLEEYLYRFVGDAHVDEFLDEAEGRGIPVTIDFDVVIRRDATALPDGERIGLVRTVILNINPSRSRSWRGA